MLPREPFEYPPAVFSILINDWERNIPKKYDKMRLFLVHRISLKSIFRCEITPVVWPTGLGSGGPGFDSGCPRRSKIGNSRKGSHGCFTSFKAIWGWLGMKKSFGKIFETGLISWNETTNYVCQRKAISKKVPYSNFEARLSR